MSLAKNSFVDHWGKWVSALGATVGLLVVLYTQGVAWADHRYIDNAELAEAIDTVVVQVKASSDLDRKFDLESDIKDLEDDIEWFGEQNQVRSALRRCRKLTRVVRAWEDAHEGDWEQDPVIGQICARQLAP